MVDELTNTIKVTCLKYAFFTLRLFMFKLSDNIYSGFDINYQLLKIKQTYLIRHLCKINQQRQQMKYSVYKIASLL